MSSVDDPNLQPRRGHYLSTSEPRRFGDFYPTPTQSIPALLNCGVDISDPSIRILDPGAGLGAWGDVIRQANPKAYIEGVEFVYVPRTPFSYTRWVTADFLADYENTDGELFDLVIGNPPFRDAEKFIRKGLSLIKEGGHLSFLLRLAFLESVGRFEGLFKELPPKQVWVSAKRIPFKPKVGKPRSTVAYAQYVWKKGDDSSVTEVHWFDWQAYLQNVWVPKYKYIVPNRYAG